MPKVELKPRGLHWFALALLVISVCINYADRGNLGVAAKSLERELHLGQGELGTLLGAFSITYAVSQFFAGKLIDRWNVNWLYAAAFSSGPRPPARLALQAPSRKSFFSALCSESLNPSPIRPTRK